MLQHMQAWIPCTASMIAGPHGPVRPRKLVLRMRRVRAESHLQAIRGASLRAGVLLVFFGWPKALPSGAAGPLCCACGRGSTAAPRGKILGFRDSGVSPGGPNWPRVAAALPTFAAPEQPPILKSCRHARCIFFCGAGACVWCRASTPALGGLVLFRSFFVGAPSCDPSIDAKSPPGHS